MYRFIVIALFVSCLSSAGATPFLDVLGFEDDVDVVTAWNGEFAVVCEERRDGSEGRVTIVDLEAATGRMLAVSWQMQVAGFEHAVDPIIPDPMFGDPGTLVVVPIESEDGSQAWLLLIYADRVTGLALGLRWIDLQDLGYCEDVDIVVAPYPSQMGFIALESEDHSVRGVLGVDLNLADAGPPGNAWGSCVLLSTDGRPGCGGNAVAVDWLPGLAEGVDPVAYTMPASVRLALPVSSWMGSDLLLLDFDNTTEPPTFLGHSSVKAVNVTSPRPTAFPGYECDVDMLYLAPGQCGLTTASLLVPVEGTGDVADLYRLDRDGHALWTLSHDGHAGGLTIPGFEAGVDLVLMCDLPGGASTRVAVPVENEAETDADLWLVKLETGELLARAEDPLINPGLSLRGWEIGVDPLRWTNDYLLLPLEGRDGTGELVVLNNGGVLQDSRVLPGGMSFHRSVDPIVAPLTDADRTLFVPIMKPNGDDADLWILRTPPTVNAGQTSLETLNPGTQVSSYEWDVDLGLVEKLLPGQAYLMLPEVPTSGVGGRLRFEEVPSVGRYLAMATKQRGGLPATLYFVRVVNGTIAILYNNLLGLEPGLDMANGRGAITPGNPPSGTLTPGFDADTDPTLAWLSATSAVPVPDPDHAPKSMGTLHHPNPFVAPGEIRFTLQAAGHYDIEVADATGRIVRRLGADDRRAGDHGIVWDGRDDEGRLLAPGLYFLHVRGAGGLLASKLILLK